MGTEIIIFRRAVEADIRDVSRQIASSYKAAYRELMTAQYLSTLDSEHWVPILQRTMDEGGTCILAQENGAVIGSAVFGRADAGKYDNLAELYAIYLLPEYVGHGAGHRLYVEAEHEMAAQGFGGCVLEVLRDNGRAIRFYEGHGFHESGAFTVAENGMQLSCITMQKQFER